MARVLIVASEQRSAAVAPVLETGGFAVRSVAPTLAGDVVDALENVAVVAYLMADTAGSDGETLATVLLKVVDTGVRGFVFERPGDAANVHVEHARETWHIPIEEVDRDADGEAVLAAVNRSLGL